MLDFGANIDKKTSDGVSCLSLATEIGDKSMVELLLKRGAQINEKGLEGKTALHCACNFSRLELVKMLLEHGADVNILDDDGNTPLMCTRTLEIKEIFIKELVRRKFEYGIEVSPENSMYLIHSEFLQETFDDCLVELKKLKDFEFYYGFSFFDILKLEKQREKLIEIITNKDFLEGFKSRWNRESFKHYGHVLDDIIQESLRSANMHSAEEEIEIICED